MNQKKIDDPILKRAALLQERIDKILTDGRASPTLRYRMPITGGGRFPRVRNALLLLAEAIRQEGEDPFESA